jgi:hypothetical protein
MLLETFRWVGQKRDAKSQHAVATYMREIQFYLIYFYNILPEKYACQRQ